MRSVRHMSCGRAIDLTPTRYRAGSAIAQEGDEGEENMKPLPPKTISDDEAKRRLLALREKLEHERDGLTHQIAGVQIAIDVLCR